MAAHRFPLQRSGAFADYNDLLTYYVGLGGNRNTTSRFRRYIGDPKLRPLLPEHDLVAATSCSTPNRRQTITLIANGRHIEYRRDGAYAFHLRGSGSLRSGMVRNSYDLQPLAHRAAENLHNIRNSRQQFPLNARGRRI